MHYSNYGHFLNVPQPDQLHPTLNLEMKHWSCYVEAFFIYKTTLLCNINYILYIYIHIVYIHIYIHIVYIHMRIYTHAYIHTW